MKEILGMVAGWGLLTVTGNEHRAMRRAMNPAFSIPNLSARMYQLYLRTAGPDLIIISETDMYYDTVSR